MVEEDIAKANIMPSVPLGLCARISVHCKPRPASWKKVNHSPSSCIHECDVKIERNADLAPLNLTCGGRIENRKMAPPHSTIVCVGEADQLTANKPCL